MYSLYPMAFLAGYVLYLCIEYMDSLENSKNVAKHGPR